MYTYGRVRRLDGIGTKELWIIVALSVVALYYVWDEWIEPDAQAEVIPNKKEVLVRYSFTLSNRSDQAIEQVNFSTFAPIESTPFQSLDSIEATAPFKHTFDELGNQTLTFMVNGLPPFGQKIITVTARLTMWTSPGVAYASPVDTSSTEKLAANEQPLANVLEALSENSPLEDRLQWAKAANKWVHTNMDDVGYTSEDRGPRYALKELKGDCTEFMHAFLSIVSTNNITAFGVAGFRIQGNSAILKASDYHNWAFFQSEPDTSAWHLADPHGDVFDEQTEKYVAFNALNAFGSERNNSQRFFIHDPRIAAEMN